MITSNRYIDNRYNEYLPYKLKNGIQCHIQPQVFFSCPQIIDTLTQDVTACLKLLPSNLYSLIQRIPIYINASYQFGPIDKPNRVTHTTAHHSHVWLETMYDLPQKSKSIEIYNAAEYLIMRRHWNGCGLILHELCHLIHQLVLPHGLNNELVLEAFGNILNKERYDTVYRRDWGYSEEQVDCAYATINHKEFFAELSVAYWSRGYDTYLKSQASDKSLESVSPPFMAIDVLQRQRGTKGARMDYEIYNSYKDTLNWKEQVDNVLTGGRAFGTGHCNKFYPFCCQQFREFDQETFDVFEHLWTCIGKWRDPYVYGHSKQVKHGNACFGFLSICSNGEKIAQNAFHETKHDDNAKDERNQTMDESITAGDSISSDVIVHMVDS